MKTMYCLIQRNAKVFFKDKGAFFSSLITPIILLVLYVTFLGNVYRDSLLSALPEGITLPEKLVGGFVGGQLLSSLLAVSCVTVAFCANMLMVSDKVTGAIRDITMAPVKPATLAISYYLATLLVTLIVGFAAMGAGMLYLAKAGWYLSWADVGRMALDVMLLVMFGTAFSSVTNVFLSSQGQISAVGTIVSSGYGFLCGAYMPIASFAPGLQHVLSFLPGTYATALIRSHTMAGVFREMEGLGLPQELVEGIQSSVDCSASFLDHPVGEGGMYAILCGSIVVLLGAYVLFHFLRRRKR